MMHRAHDQNGFALISVLLAIGVMAGFVAAFGAHVVIARQSQLTSTPLLESRESCQSGLVVAQQSLLAGDASAQQTFQTGNASVDISVLEDVADLPLIEVFAHDGAGLGTRRRASLELRAHAAESPTTPAQLPRLSSDTIDELLADADLPRTHITSSRRLQDTDLDGLLIVHEGVELSLAGVVLRGAVVSAASLGAQPPGDFDPNLAPELIIDGDLRIDSHPSFDGVAILMPDGQVTGLDPEARLQIRGDVVAHDVALGQAGALDGHVSAVNAQLPDGSVFDRLGASRKDEAWSSPLDLGGTREAVQLAFVNGSTSLESLAPIIDYWSED